ncbi:efflux RND transporter periplasmic adaptor subunit [Ramlibacter sp. G-1-2-2]|uniref:Efflux RND transporter periplasmic adaptor subunit n=1 Tax=Ramlibacter agri TaxID=2728837 RepID=A0A848H3T3_9BURK|nr:efflux RND transporter periplasmic adaptor subunit [Ramlibacter agri]NML45167.1 efflux RND transporter periplasmic adaptor subunit [Ramlibacter agri]
MKKLPSRLLTGSAVAAAALLLGACSRTEAPADPVRAVKVVTVGASSLQAVHEFSGEVKPRVESRIGFRVAGKVLRRQAEVGQRVQAGQLLAQLDPQDYRLAADAARAQVAAATTNRDLAAADYKRYVKLKEENFIAGAEVERRETALKAAQAQLEQAQAQLASQGNQARYTDLLADAAGVVTAVEAEPGQVVAAGTPIVRIAQDGLRDVVFSVPEDKVGAVQTGGPVTVKSWSTGATLPGRIREVAASADPVTRTYPVKVSLDSPTPPPLGATVSVMPQALSHVGAQVIKLPTSALRQEGQGTAVWVLERKTMTVRSQPVTVATADGNDAVIASGLTPGMLVVSAGVHVLSPGQKVTIWQDKTAAAPALASQPQPVSVPAGMAQSATSR